VAINSGTNLHISGLYCDGGHGLSIGSVGGRTQNNVQNVTFAASVVANSQNGVRIKTVYNATGSASFPGTSPFVPDVFSAQAGFEHHICGHCSVQHQQLRRRHRAGL
jgi:hypothetical protein